MMTQWSIDIAPGISAVQALSLINEKNVLNYHPVVAVLDTGVDYRHPAIKNNITAGYNAYNNSNDPQPRPRNNNHGTSCAGIIAMMKQGGIDWQGVAPNAVIMPVKISQQEGVEFHMSDNSVVKGILKAVDLGADILNICWGKEKASDKITDAINYALTQGRGGKGCVVCCASGDGRSIMYPAYLPGVLCIGASNQYEEYKSTTSSDNEKNWESASGKEIDIVAPGVLISSIENQNSYTTTFNGTSAAAPHVSGVAALLLAVNPGLSADAVQGILKKTADPVLPEKVSGHNIHSGYGRVNALSAVELAIETLAHAELGTELAGWSKQEKAQRLV